LTELSPIEAQNAKLRETAHAQRAGLDYSDRVEAAKAAAQNFMSGINIGDEEIIAAYWPIRDEIDCKPLLAQLMDSFRHVCLPAVLGDGLPLQFRLWEQGESLYEAGFGTLAPPQTAPIVEPDTIIVPLLGFDRNGTRLGYGKGYYDRSLEAMEKTPVLVGYAFAIQEIEEIPHEIHDVPLDYLVTEAGVRRFHH
jgi:5-formyltetrahydrofolate cyclo-ligase